MDELIAMLTSKLGIDASTASAGVNTIMSFLKENVGDDLFDQTASSVAGAGDAAAAGEADSDGSPAGGGLLGKLTSMASTALGSQAGGGLEIASSLASSGIDAEKLAPFVSTVVDFLKEKLGDDVVDQVLGKLPMLKTLLG